MQYLRYIAFDSPVNKHYNNYGNICGSLE